MDAPNSTVPPPAPRRVAHRPAPAPTAALKEELTDSWRLLLACVGATASVSAALYTLTTLVG